MKKFTLFLAILLLGTIVSLGQITAMFVNDESENEQNALFVYQTLKNSLPELVMFNAVDSLRSPTTGEMNPYQLVIWYCGSDAKDLYFWKGAGQTNNYLASYLDDGGVLWLMGSGFLNDRYIFTPVYFSTPSFAYDYLGIWGWYMETYTDDGGLGVPQLDIHDENPITTLNLEAVSWSDPPEPWVDGIQLADDCDGIYQLGPESYPDEGYPAAFYNTANDLHNITFTFDPARMDSVKNVDLLFSEIVQYYNNLISGTDDQFGAGNSILVYPNPANNYIFLQLKINGEYHIDLIDFTGNIVREKTFIASKSSNATSRVSVSDLPSGIYFLRISNKSGSISKSIVVAR